MIHEIAYLTIDPAKAEAFAAAVKAASPHFQKAEGCHGMRLERVIEDPARYRLVIGWESVDHHMVRFRNSDAFQLWRELASPFFTAPPTVEHVDTVAAYF